MNELVTISIAVHNDQKVVKRCIESVINQSYNNLEIVIVDDGSTDNSYEICASYSNDSRIKLFHQDNNGLSASRNTALKNCHGKFISFIDADDYLEHRYVENLLKAIDSDSSDIVVCGTRFISSDGRVREKDTKGYGFESNLVPLKIDDDLIINYFSDLCVKYHMFDSWNKMYRVSFVLNSGVTFSQIKGLSGNDLMFNYKLMMHNPTISAISFVGYNHIVSEYSSFSKKDKLIDSYINIFTELEIESNKCGLGKRVNQQLGESFIKDMMTAMSYSMKMSTAKERINELLSIQLKIIRFINQHDSIDFAVNSRSSKTVRFFSHIYLKNVYVLYVFLYIKQFL